MCTSFSCAVKGDQKEWMAACSCVNEEAPISEEILVGAFICDGKERD